MIQSLFSGHRTVHMATHALAMYSELRENARTARAVQQRLCPQSPANLPTTFVYNLLLDMTT